MKNKDILSGHTKKGKVFIPPLKSKLGIEEIKYSDEILPEIIWLAYLYNEDNDYKKDTKNALSLLKTFHKIHNPSEYRSLAIFTNLKFISDAEWSAIKQSIFYEKIKTVSLLSFVKVYPDSNPLAKLFDEPIEAPTKEEIYLTKNLIAKLFNRRSRFAMIVQSIIVGNQLNNDKIYYSKDFKPPDINTIFDDEESEERQRAYSHVRIQVNMLLSIEKKENLENKWNKVFWERSSSLEPIEFMINKPENISNFNHPMEKLGIDYELKALNFLESICNNIAFSISESEIFESISGLLTRQTKLAISLAKNPHLWDWDIGPLLLRSMTDCHITLAWILIDPLDRSRKYIDYGLGQEKLQIEYLEKLELDDKDPEYKENIEMLIDARKSWLNSQHFTFLQSVNIGNWAGKNTREMAQEADCLPLYKFSYTPWTHVAHGNWNHVGKFNLAPSGNPLHKFISVPFYNTNMSFEIDVLFKCTKYLDRTFNLLQSKYSQNSESFRDWFNNRFDKLKIELEKAKND